MSTMSKKETGLVSEIKVANGILQVFDSCDPSYPGVIIEFKPDGEDIGYQIVRVENIPKESETPVSTSGTLNTYVWANPESEDSTFTSAIPVQDIKECLNGNY